MAKINEGHLVGFGSVRDMTRLEEDYYGEFTDAGLSEIQFPRYHEVPSKDECDLMCAKLSGEVKIKTKPLSL